MNKSIVPFFIALLEWFVAVYCFLTAITFSFGVNFCLWFTLAIAACISGFYVIIDYYILN